MPDPCVSAEKLAPLSADLIEVGLPAAQPRQEDVPAQSRDNAMAASTGAQTSPLAKELQPASHTHHLLEGLRIQIGGHATLMILGDKGSVPSRRHQNLVPDSIVRRQQYIKNVITQRETNLQFSLEYTLDTSLNFLGRPRPNQFLPNLHLKCGPVPR